MATMCECGKKAYHREGVAANRATKTLASVGGQPRMVWQTLSGIPVQTNNGATRSDQKVEQAHKFSLNRVSSI